MNNEEIIKYCLTLENTYKDCPFPDDFESVTMKHLKNKKWFALIGVSGLILIYLLIYRYVNKNKS